MQPFILNQPFIICVPYKLTTLTTDYMPSKSNHQLPSTSLFFAVCINAQATTSQHQWITNSARLNELLSFKNDFYDNFYDGNL